MNRNKLNKKEQALEREARNLIMQFRLILVAAVLVLAGGMIFYHFIEKLSWIDSLYFSIISFTTVGYGDIYPTTDAGKLFTAFYVIVGIAIFGALINNLIKTRIAKRTLHELEDLSER